MLIHQKVIIKEIEKRIKEFEENAVLFNILPDGIKVLKNLLEWVASEKWDKAIRNEYLKQEKEKIKN